MFSLRSIEIKNITIYKYAFPVRNHLPKNFHLEPLQMSAIQPLTQGFGVYPNHCGEIQIFFIDLFSRFREKYN